MKHIKILGLAVIATAALMATVAGSASATGLTSPNGHRLPVGTTIHAFNLNAVVVTTTFLNIPCDESTFVGRTTTESGSAVEGKVESLTWGGCNCEVKTLAGGTFAITSAGSSDGAFSSSGAEVTMQCSTIFGAVHCIYKTSNTGLGTLTGSTTTGGTATIDISSANIPRLSTSAICAEKATLDGKYKIDNPNELFVD